MHSPVSLLAVLAAVLVVASATSAAVGAGGAAEPRGVARSGVLELGDVNGTVPIDHIVVVMQENHVYDNYFGTYCLNVGPYCSVNATGLPAGSCVPLDPTNLPEGCIKPYLYSWANVTTPSDNVHDWAAAHQSYDNGSMDGFYLAEGKHLSPFGYYDGSLLPTYWDIAEEYGLGDNFYASTLSYSTPNHWYLLAGQSPAEGINQTLHKSSNPTVLTNAEEAYLNEANDTPTITDLLTRANVSWSYYDYPLSNYSHAIHAEAGAGLDDSAFDFWNPLAAQAESYQSNDSYHFVASSQFFTDAAAGTLPNVSWVLPTFNDSDHPPASLVNGETWVSSVINAVEHSPEWNSTVVFVSWDDFGGYYDHLPPPQLDGDGVSMRVPLLVVGAYVRENYVGHHFEYFESLLHFIEWRYHLPSLTARDANAPLPLDYFDFNATPRAPWTVPGPTTATYPAPLQAVGAPLAPANVTVEDGTGELTVNWTESRGGSAPSAAVVAYNASGGAPTTLRLDPSEDNVTIAGLAGGTPYTVRLTLVVGASSSATVTLAGTPIGGGSAAPTTAPAGWAQLPNGTGPSPPARSAAGFAFDALDGVDLLFGGVAANGSYLGDTWEYLDGTWVALHPNPSPSARAYAAMAWDATDGVVLLFGGKSSHVLGDTWKFADGHWTNLTAGHSLGRSPPARYGAGVGNDGADDYVVLFGGHGATSLLSDTWHFSAGHWSPAKSAASPTARLQPALAFDPDLGAVVLFGGNSSAGLPRADTWTYSAGAWRSVAVARPPPARAGAALAYDGRDGELVLVGGAGTSGPLSDAWTFESGLWTAMSSSPLPPARSSAGIAFDGLREGVYYVDGVGPQATYPTSVWVYAPGLGLAVTVEAANATIGSAVYFAASISGGLSTQSYLWSFGDGATSTILFAEHRFSSAGSFIVTLQVTTVGGLSAAVSVTVDVAAPLGPVARAHLRRAA